MLFSSEWSVWLIKFYHLSTLKRKRYCIISKPYLNINLPYVNIQYSNTGWNGLLYSRSLLIKQNIFCLWFGSAIPWPGLWLFLLTVSQSWVHQRETGRTYSCTNTHRTVYFFKNDEIKGSIPISKDHSQGTKFKCVSYCLHFSSLQPDFLLYSGFKGTDRR